METSSSIPSFLMPPPAYGQSPLASRAISALIHPTSLVPFLTHTDLRPAYLTIVEAERRGGQVAATKATQKTQRKNQFALEREVGGLCRSTQRQTLPAPLESWPCISPGIYCQSIQTLSIHIFKVPWSLARWAQAGVSPYTAGHARLREQEAL